MDLIFFFAVVKYAMFYSLIRKEEFIFLNILSDKGYLLIYLFIYFYFSDALKYITDLIGA